MHISGDNFQNGQSRTEYSYYFSKYSFSWGWASWRRAWKNYDYNIKTWPEAKKAGLIEQVCDNSPEQKFWRDVFDQMYNDQQTYTTWDYQWLYACWLNKGLSVIPDVNLVSNIGFGEDGTHCKGEHKSAALQTFDIGDIKHPTCVEQNKEADKYIFKHNFAGE